MEHHLDEETDSQIVDENANHKMEKIEKNKVFFIQMIIRSLCCIIFDASN